MRLNLNIELMESCSGGVEDDELLFLLVVALVVVLLGGECKRTLKNLIENRLLKCWADHVTV